MAGGGGEAGTIYWSTCCVILNAMPFGRRRRRRCAPGCVVVDARQPSLMRVCVEECIMIPVYTSTISITYKTHVKVGGRRGGGERTYVHSSACTCEVALRRYLISVDVYHSISADASQVVASRRRRCGDVAM